MKECCRGVAITADAYERRAEKAEALVADLENQIAEGLAGMDQAEGRIAELEEALEEIKDDFIGVADECGMADMGRQAVRQTARDVVGIVDKALSGDGSAYADVVYRHRKGGLYRVIARGLLERDLTPVVVYRALSDGTYWVRPAEEFDDGRFEALDKMEDDHR